VPGIGVQANAAVASRILLDVRRGLQAAAAEHLKASVRELPRAVPGTPENDGYVRKSKKRGGRTAKNMSCTVLSTGLEIWMVDGSGIAEQIHKAGTAATETELPKIIERAMPKAEAALNQALQDIPGDEDIEALVHRTVARSDEFLQDAPKHLEPPPGWAEIMAGARGRAGA
jgi:hypothetical protein